MNLTIDTANLKDLESILRVRISAILNDARPALSEDEVIEWTEKPKESETREQIERGEIWVARNKDKIIAWIRVKNSEVEGLYVDGKHQKLGIGRDLLLFLEKHMSNSGTKKVHLNAALNSIAFYKSCGYIELPNESYGSMLGMEKVLNTQSIHNNSLKGTANSAVH